MPTPDEFIAEVHTWLGTPFAHQGRTKGTEADCAGVVIESARALGLTTFQITDYSEQSDEARFNALLREHLLPVAFRDRQPGDVLSFAPLLRHQHLGVLIHDDLFVHAYALDPKKVIKSRLAADWLYRLRGVWRFPEFL